MKKGTIKLLGVSLLVTALAIPVLAWAHGPGGGPMMGKWGAGPGYGRHYYGAPGTVAPEQQQRLLDLQRKFFDETTELRNQLWSKSAELNALLRQTNPDQERAKALQGEINDLRAKLSEKAFNYRLEAQKAAPDAGFGGRYGRFRGPRMGGYGPGMGMGMGYGPGSCWR
ncbi:MAG: periplasmic heavy metal sensor [Deltaproteobacteria bacterium]|nr:periplasmic heavy metal sensor [Deltaproteobacteria bacterium]MBW2138639.1 periplasmic heavy metal sensor [Deltaproteobacteria bacterium]